jgi:hypothetical protein
MPRQRVAAVSSRCNGLLPGLLARFGRRMRATTPRCALLRRIVSADGAGCALNRAA